MLRWPGTGDALERAVVRGVDDMENVTPWRARLPGRACSWPYTSPSCGPASAQECAVTATELPSGATGYTVEIGGGTGINLPHYPEDLHGLVVVEPDASMRPASQRDRASGRRARVVDAPAEQLPFADGSVDTVVSTLVLCTVDAPDLALREIPRVLQEDGQLLFIEHVRSDSPRLAGWQDRLAGPGVASPAAATATGRPLS